MAQNWDYWRADLKSPQNRDVTDPGQGYWRHKAAKTKIDWPIAVWFEGEEPVIKVGDSVTRGQDALLEFLSGSTWLNAVAVPHADYLLAKETGKWSDGKPARKMTEAERLDIDANPGGNQAPIEESIAEQIAAAVAQAEKITKIENEEDARVANELAAKLQTLWKLGDMERIKEKRPHDEAAQAVQAKWLPIIGPAAEQRERLVKPGTGIVQRWLKAEQERVEREMRERQAAEEEARRQEAEKAAAEAAERGEPAPEPIPQPDPAPAAPAPRVQAGNSFGRATGLRKVTTGVITDMKKFITSKDIINHKEMKELAQTLANRAAKAGIKVPGMEIKEDLQ
jgi:hypothetical protein